MALFGLIRTPRDCAVRAMAISTGVVAGIRSMARQQLVLSAVVCGAAYVNCRYGGSGVARGNAARVPEPALRNRIDGGRISVFFRHGVAFVIGRHGVG